MIYDIARRHLPSDIDSDSITEVVQKCMIWLWQKSLPKYNAWRVPSVKVSTFLHTCATNFILQERRTINRSRRANQGSLITQKTNYNNAQGMMGPDLDRKIEQLAKDIIANPEKYMTGSQVTVFNAVLNNPDRMMKDLADDLNYARASSLSMIKRRIRERISEIDIEGIVLPPDDDYQEAA